MLEQTVAKPVDTCLDLLTWVRLMRKNRTFTESVADNFLSALNRLLPLSGENWQELNVHEVDVELLVHRAIIDGLKPRSGGDYKKRACDAIKHYIEFTKDPFAWQRSLVIVPSKIKNRQAVKVVHGAEKNELKPSDALAFKEYTFPLFDGIEILFRVPPGINFRRLNKDETAHILRWLQGFEEDTKK